MKNYREDIDGLRALAVIPVILFHAGFDWISGGFLGVDVFFVISGFLITSIILDNLIANKFSILEFYERRARRILPVLFTVLITTYIASFILMPPFEFKEFSQSLVSVALFVSNVFFYSEINYFSLNAEEMPLLHTWSLAIEEQFYLIFPLFLVSIWRINKKIIPIFISGIIVLSFFSSSILNNAEDKAANFYWITSRAWELLIGSLTAILIKSDGASEKTNNKIANFGLVVLILSFLLFHKELAHPGLATLFPTLATCLIIIHSKKGSICYSVLSNRILVFIGLISYSLYLWHQPLLAFLKLKTIGKPEPLILLLFIAIAFIISIFSYKFIECPFRDKSNFSKILIFKLSIGTTFLIGSLGLFGHFNQGLPSRFSNSEYVSSMQFSPKRNACHASKERPIPPSEVCIYFLDYNVTWAVFGDSHVVEPAFALAKHLRKQGEGLKHFSYSGCPPALNYLIKNNEECTNWLNQSISTLENSKNITNVLLGFRYSAAIFGKDIPNITNSPQKVILKPAGQNDLNDAQKLELYWNNLYEIIQRLIKSGKTVHLLYPIPELPIHISKAASPFSIFGKGTLINLEHAVSKEHYEIRNKFILDKLNKLPKSSLLKKINVFNILCKKTGCPAIIGNKSLYFDDDHLSIAGATFLLENYIKQTSNNEANNKIL